MGNRDPDACDLAVVANSHSIDIQWANGREADFPADAQLAGWCEAVLDWLKDPPAAVCVRMMSAGEIAELNLRYRNKAGATNVLSFPADGEDESGRRLLGDLAICSSVVREQALHQGKSLAAHTAHMLVHGILHLSGFDHENDRDAQEMERREIAILQQFGFSDPYAEIVGQEDKNHE